VTAVDVHIEPAAPGTFEDAAVHPAALPCRAKRHRYLYGDCALLALAVNELTGWPVVSVNMTGNNGHVVVSTPGGRLLDADGLHDPDDDEEPVLILGPFRSVFPEITEQRWRQPDVRADAAELLCQYEQALREAS
jgi:hypothetical protein